MSIPAIPPMPSMGLTPGFGVSPAYGVSAPQADRVAEYQSSGAVSFGGMLADKIAELDALHATSDTLAVKAVTGDLQDIHQYTIAANEANVATQLTVALRNKAVESFTEIMRMQM